MTGMHDVRVAIVGAGFGGLGAAIRLKEAGIDDLVVLERAAGLGGTWRENTYPGCACDVPSHLYSFSFALNPEWSRIFAPQHEILGYLERTARERGVDGLIRLRTEVHGATWSDDEQRWHVRTSAGDVRAQVLISATGPLSQPNRPDIEGLDTFAGTLFHSAEWDHGHALAGERVAVIGTGASAAQFVPHVAREARHTTVFQRTPGWVLPRNDFPQPAAVRRLLARVPALQRAIRSGIYYGAESLVVGLAKDQRALIPAERVGRWHLRRQVTDPATRAKLTPDFRIGCKRIIFSDDYLPTFNRPDVSLVCDPIARVVPEGVVTADGTLHEADTIVLGTGFRLYDNPTLAGIVGRDGRTMAETWAPTGPVAYRGTVVSGFPNHFLLIGPNTGLGNNSMVNIIECQLTYVLDALRALDGRGLASLDVRPEVQNRWNAAIQERMRGTVWTDGGCKSWYLTPEGVNRTLWPSFSDAFKRALQGFDVADFDTVPASLPAPVPAAASA
jgi:cation diffusion facilitator CzcD-associated flavoprotein CzcO